jgi:hypothetical protein
MANIDFTSTDKYHQPPVMYELIRIQSNERTVQVKTQIRRVLGPHHNSKEPALTIGSLSAKDFSTLVAMKGLDSKYRRDNRCTGLYRNQD